MASDEEDDDYMTMTLPTESIKPSTSSLSRAEQKRRANAEKAHKPSNAAVEHERLKRLERGLRTNLSDTTASDESMGKSKGAALMAKLGYKGGPLGRKEAADSNDTATKAVAGGVAEKQERLLDPIRVQLKNNKFGIGTKEEEEPGMKRAREALEYEEARAKRLRSEMGGYRERVGKEGDEKRKEGQWWGAMRVIDTLREQEELKSGGENGAVDKAKDGDVPLELRALLKQREEDEEEKRVRRSKAMLLDRAGDEEKDEDDRVAMGETLDELPEIAGADEDEDEDVELEKYVALPAEERLDRTVKYLREKYWYCFWCKARYDDAELDGCPGLTEEDHD